MAGEGMSTCRQTQELCMERGINSLCDGSAHGYAAYLILTYVLTVIMHAHPRIMKLL